MGKLKDIKWFEWGLFLVVLYYNVPQLGAAILRLLYQQDSAWIPHYASLMRRIDDIGYIAITCMGFLGILFYLKGQRTGWILLVSNIGFIFIFHLLNLIERFPSLGLFLYIYFLLDVGALAVLYAKKKSFKIRFIQIIIAASIITLLAFLEFNKVSVSQYLSHFL